MAARSLPASGGRGGRGSGGLSEGVAQAVASRFIGLAGAGGGRLGSSRGGGCPPPPGRGGGEGFGGFVEGDDAGVVVALHRVDEVEGETLGFLEAGALPAGDVLGGHGGGTVDEDDGEFPGAGFDVPDRAHQGEAEEDEEE